MPRPNSVLTSVIAATAAVLAGVTTASASRDPSPDDRVDAVIAEFDAIVTEAGFVLDGDRDEIDDPLGLTEEDDDSTMDDCLPPDDVVAEDGTFVGQVAGSSSGEYQFTDGEPVGTDDMDWLDHESIGIAVAIVDEDATPSLRAVVDEMAGEEFGDCLATAFDEWLAARPGEDTGSTAPFEASTSVEPLDIGDASAIFGVRQSGVDDDGDEHTFAASMATAMVGDTFIAVVYSTFAGDANSDVVVPALEAAAAAAG